MAAEGAVQMWVAGGILSGAYLLIFTEWMHRTLAAVAGAVVMVGAGIWGGFYSEVAAVHAIDGNTMFLLTGMMIMVAMLRPTGGFEYLAIRIAKLSRNSPRRLMLYLGLAVSLLSMFLDNVTTVIIFAPITLLITRMLGLNPAPFLMAEAMLSNIGGAATLVGDPPNIMIGSAAAIDFNSFLLNMGPMVLVAWGASMTLLLLLFRDALRPGEGAGSPLDLDERRAIKDPLGLALVLFALACVIVLFFLHHHLGLYPAFVALIGVALVFVLVRPEPEALLREVEWSVLLFFAALFVLVGGVEQSGLLALVGEGLAGLARDPGSLLLTSLLVIWVAALLSAVVDNIPFTVTMIPILSGLESQGIAIGPLWWALAIGVGLGGNGTHLGATANVICVAELERSGIPEARVSPGRWLQVGLPTTIASLVVASGLFALLFPWLGGHSGS